MRNAMWVGGGITGMGEIPMLGVKEKGIAKVIRDIFRNGEKGFFYDPSDLKTQYQDAAGTAAVSTSGQPVGLMLDKSKGLELGSELVINGTFDTGIDGWNSTGAALEYSGSQLKVTVTASSANRISQSIATIVGKFYVITCDITPSLSNTVKGLGRFKITSGVDRFTAGGLTDGVSNRVQIIVQAKSSITTISVEVAKTGYWGAVGDSILIDNVSVKELKGNHAYQTTSAARPLLLQKPILGNDIITNGDFINGLNSWSDVLAGTNGVWWQNVAGRAYHPSTAGYRELNQTLPTINVAIVEFDYEVLSANNSAQFIYINSSGSVKTRLLPKGSGRVTLTLTDGIKFIAFGRTTGYAAEFYIDRVSVKSVMGYIQDRNYIEYDGIDDKLFTNLPTPLVNATVLRAIPNEGTQVKYNQTLPMLYEDSTNHSGLIAIDRTLTRSEQLRLMTELDKKAGATGFDTATFKMFDGTQQGFFYDPNDLSTMFQDSAGTIPVTAVGQPVGLIKDKSGRNNHAYQTVSASRPTLSSRVNMLTGSDTLAYWSSSNTVKEGNVVKAAGASSSIHICYRMFTYVPSSTVTYYIEVKKGIGFCFFQLCYSNFNRAKCTINLATGEKAVKVLSTNTTNAVVEDGGDVWRLTLTGSATGASGGAYANMGFATSLKDDICNSYDEPIFLASGSESMTIKATDLRDTHIGSNLPKYQRVTSATDYDSEGFPNYLVFDGVDDFLQTNNIDFTDTDKVSLFTGVNKTTTNIAAGVILELGVNATTNSSSFFLASPNNNVRSLYGFRSRGKTTGTTLDVSSADIVVISAFSDLSANKNSLRLNSSESVQSIDTGGGVFGSYPLYIGRRGGTTLPFKGHIYGLIGVGRLTTNDETIAIEKELAKRTGVTLNV